MNKIKSRRPIGFEIIALSNQIKRQGPESSVGEENVTAMQSRIIGYLMRNSTQDVFQKDIESVFNIRRSTASGILRLMEENCLLQKVPVNYDARLKKLVLTPKAIRIGKKIRREIDDLENRLIKELTPEEVNTFYYLINKIKKNLE